MPHISVIVSQDLYNRLLKKQKELECHNLSDAIRVLLNATTDKKSSSIESKAKNKQLQYIAATYYLLNGYIGDLGESGAKINKKAHAKAEQVIAELIN